MVILSFCSLLKLVIRLESAAILSKSDIAATKLRYEQQVYNLQTELNAQQV